MDFLKESHNEINLLEIEKKKKKVPLPVDGNLVMTGADTFLPSSKSLSRSVRIRGWLSITASTAGLRLTPTPGELALTVRICTDHLRCALSKPAAWVTACRRSVLV